MNSSRWPSRLPEAVARTARVAVLISSNPPSPASSRVAKSPRTRNNCKSNPSPRANNLSPSRTRVSPRTVSRTAATRPSAIPTDSRHLRPPPSSSGRTPMVAGVCCRQRSPRTCCGRTWTSSPSGIVAGWICTSVGLIAFLTTEAATHASTSSVGACQRPGRGTAVL